MFIDSCKKGRYKHGQPVDRQIFAPGALSLGVSALSTVIRGIITRQAKKLCVVKKCQTIASDMTGGMAGVVKKQSRI